MSNIVFTGLAEVKGNRISGRALVPGISRNGNLYTPDMIETSTNLGVPLKLDWEHTDEILGSVVFEYKKELQELHYTGTLTKHPENGQITEGVTQVSIEAQPERVEHVCTPNACYNMPINLTWEGLGITNNPGVTASTLMVESHWNDCSNEKCKECNDPTKHPELKIDPETRMFSKEAILDVLRGMGLLEALDLEYCEECDKIEKKTKQ